MGYIENIRASVGNMPIILVSAGVIIEDGNNVLLCYRKDTNDWGLPGGYMEPGETVLETAFRELKEEMKVIPDDLQFYRIFSGQDFYHEYPNGDQVYSVIVMFTTSSSFVGKITVDHQEIEEAKFFSLDSLPPKLTKTTQNILEVYKNG
ncbi:NUDIX domain-containing protein [Bacillus shivajii]|uniref:NUDIX hydrolase n=1 Tax=Bacillus shivajii TaxID=1983719 RepID=UPI001CF96398|nr:NUDIX domain-containing protein [Bacillus shivajii]UCZ52784.1 NUDIX domain-containing protein [Bacillus shivajii]